jgi:hypothetical protein
VRESEPNEPTSIPWLVAPPVSCDRCRAQAEHVTLGHMYRTRCAACGFEESGTWSPASEVLPRAKPFNVYVELAGIEPTGKNLFALSKLHTSLGKLKPAELKAMLVAGGRTYVGEMPLWEAQLVQRAAANTAYTVSMEQCS